MADQQQDDPILAEIRKAKGGGGVAVAEPEDDPILAEIRKRAGTSSKENRGDGLQYHGDDLTPESKQKLGIAPGLRNDAGDLIDTSGAAKMMPLTGGAVNPPAQVGRQTPFTPPVVPRPTAPQPNAGLPTSPYTGAVAGKFGEPELSDQKQREQTEATATDAQKGNTMAPQPHTVANWLDNLRGSILKRAAPARFDAKGNKLPDVGEVMAGPVTGPLKAAKGFIDLYGGSPEGTPEKEQNEQAIRGTNDIFSGLFETASLPALVTQPEAIPFMTAYSGGAQASNKALTGIGVKPDTAELITNTALMFGPALYHLSDISGRANAEVARRSAVNVMQSVAVRSLEFSPNLPNMTQDAQGRVIMDAARSVAQDIASSNEQAKVNFQKLMGMDPPKYLQDLEANAGSKPQGALPQGPPQQAGAAQPQQPQPELPTAPQGAPEAQEKQGQPKAPESPVESPEPASAEPRPVHEVLAQGLEDTAKKLRENAGTEKEAVEPASVSPATSKEGIPQEPQTSAPLAQAADATEAPAEQRPQSRKVAEMGGERKQTAEQKIDTLDSEITRDKGLLRQNPNPEEKRVLEQRITENQEMQESLREIKTVAAKQEEPVPLSTEVTPAEKKTQESLGAQEEARALDRGETPEKPSTAKFAVKLPNELAGAKPRYALGANQFPVEFESDVDKAAYITAQSTPSKRDADYLKFAMNATGLNEQQVREYGKEVRGRIKELARSADVPGETLKVPAQKTAPKAGLPTEPHGTSDIATSSEVEKQEAQDVFKNEKDGTESRVTTGTDSKYHVTLHDTDSGEVLETARKYPDKRHAIAYAKFLVSERGAPVEESLAPESESDTLPVERKEATDESSGAEQPAEERDERKPVGEGSGEPLGEVLPEDVRGTEERGLASGESDRGGGTDTERPLEDGERRGTGLPKRVGSGEGEIPLSTERTGRGGPGTEPGQLTAGARAGNDYRITERDNLGIGGERTKYRANVAAIRTLKQIERDGRIATPEEQQILVKYVGWGGIASNQLFNSDTEGGKHWADEYKDLKALLTPEEYTRARASTTNAHYTSLPVVRAMWDALQRLGFKDGSMLEPSAGIGHFLGLEPSELSVNTRRTAVELDPLSGRIMRQLYQSADVRIQNFGDFNAPNDTYDIAVGNVPFGKIIVNDSAYNKHKLSIHNYFILKTLDKLRPGGVAALITSAHTLDAADSKHLKLFQSRADLVGAIRLPNNAFKGNAGTEVTTDIIFFRKRLEGEDVAGKEFQKQKEITNDKGEKLHINEYFSDHPEMMMGQMELAGTMRRAGEPALIARPGQDINTELAKAIEKLPANVLTWRPPESTAIEASADSIPEFRELKQYGLAIKNGKVFRRIGDATQQELDFPKKYVNTLKDMLTLRDAARELLQAEVKDRPVGQLSDLRKRLNNSYDRFVEKHGIVHNPRNEKAMSADPDLPLLLSLENYDKSKKQAEKATIFTKRVVNPVRVVTSATNAKDAMLVSLADKGRLDFDHMAQLTGKPAEELQSELKEAGLVFHTPDGHWETSDMYLSGNVRRKLVEAQTAAVQNEEFKANAEALRAVIPADVPPSRIYLRLGATWLPKQVVKDFITETLGVGSQRNITLEHNVRQATWDLALSDYHVDSVKNSDTWGTSRASATWLISQGLNQRTPVIYDNGPNDTKVVNQKETTAAQDKLESLNKELHRWIFQDSPHSEEMAQRYNELFNATVEWKPNGDHLTMPGSSPEVQLRNYQKHGVWRAVAGKTNTLLAWEVGLGKSYTLAGTAMEWRRLGLKKKPMLVVPTHLVEQFRQDFMRMYPMANVLAADKSSFETLNRKEFLSRITTGEWDAVIVGDSQFGRMPSGSSISQEAMDETLAEAREQLQEAEAGKDRRTVKEIETQIANIEAQIDRLRADEKKDDVTPFNELGVDGLLLDEAHRMKSLYFPTKMGRLRGVPRTKSQRSMDTYIKTKYITKLNNGNGVVFSTGTPITNTIAEAWIMSKFLDEQNLKDSGMNHFDGWAANFGQAVSQAEGHPENPTKLRMVTRFNKFNNIPEASSLFRRVADIRFADDEGLKRPKMVGGKMQAGEVPPSAAQLAYTQELIERAKNARGKKPEKGADNMLVITGDGRKAAIDMRMVDANAEDDPASKLNNVAREAAQFYHGSRDQKSTQLIALDLRQGAGGFDSYNELRSKMVSLGIPKNEIAFIQDYKTGAAKQGLFNRINSGDIAVVMGSSDTLGVGVNVQKRLARIERVDPPWRPDMVEQVNGRGIRFGNDNPEVLVRNWVTKKSFDAYMWHILKVKNNFLTQFMKGDPNVRTIEDVSGRAMNPDEMEAAAADDPRLFKKMELESSINRLESLKRSFNDQQFDNKARMARLPERIASHKQKLADVKSDIELRDSRPEQFSMTVGKKHYDERKEAGAALNEAIQGHSGKPVKVGDLGGFSIYASENNKGYLHGKNSWDFSMGKGTPNEKGEVEPSALGTVQSIEASMRGMDNNLKYHETELPKLEKELKDRKAKVDDKFDREKELTDSIAEVKKLDDEMGLNSPENDIQEAAPEPEPEKEDEDDDEAGFATPDFLTFGLAKYAEKIRNAISRMRARHAAARGAADEVTEDEAPYKPPEGIPTGPSGSEEPGPPKSAVEYAANIRLDKLNTSEDVLNLIRETAKVNAARINAQRRGKLSDKDLRDRMEEVGLDADKLMNLKKGTALNEAEMQVAIGIMIEKGEAVRAASKAAQENNSTENLLRAQMLHNEYVAIQAAVSGAKAESGRALRIQRMISESFQSKSKSDYEKLIDALGGRKLADKEAEKLLQIPEGDRAGYHKFLRDHTRFSLPQKVVAYWMNNILSSPRTFIRKSLGDAAMMGLSVPERFARAGIDPLMAKLQGRHREFYMRDAVSQTAASLVGFWQGMKVGSFMLWNGFDLKDAEALDLPIRYELPGGLAMNWPTRILAGATAMFKTAHYVGAIHGEAMRLALKEGLRGRAAGDRAAELVAEPTDAMVNKAQKEAGMLALVEDPDATLRSLLNFRERFLKIPEDVPVVGGLSPMRFVVPFANIGWNIAKNAFRYSPAGVARFAKRSVREGPEASNVLAQALIGSLVMALLAQWASQGNMTGAAPKAGPDKDAFYRSGKQPFSIKIGGHWVRYTAGWGPLALMAGAVSGWHDSFKDGKKPNADQVGQAAAALGNAITDQTFFRGLENLNEAITDPEKKGADFAAELAGGFVPFSGFLRTWAEALDPKIRQPEGIYERVKAGLPVVSKSVPARVDAMGRETERTGGTGAAAFLPAPIPEDKPQTSVDAELARLHEMGLRNPGFVSRSVTIDNTRIPLGRKEQAEFQKIHGAFIRQVLENTFSDPDYQKMSDQDKLKEAEAAIREAEDTAHDEMISRVMQRRLGTPQPQKAGGGLPLQPQER
jgi:N12 class adenine-specific DNA methylase